MGFYCITKGPACGPAWQVGTWLSLSSGLEGGERHGASMCLLHHSHAVENYSTPSTIQDYTISDDVKTFSALLSPSSVGICSVLFVEDVISFPRITPDHAARHRDVGGRVHVEAEWSAPAAA